jgi:hypothetical protein
MLAVVVAAGVAVALLAAAGLLEFDPQAARTSTQTDKPRLTLMALRNTRATPLALAIVRCRLPRTHCRTCKPAATIDM